MLFKPRFLASLIHSFEYLDIYNKVINIEARTMLMMVKHDIMPVIIEYKAKLAQSIVYMNQAGFDLASTLSNSSAILANISATTVLIVVLGFDNVADEPTILNSNLLPVKAKGLVLFLQKPYRKHIVFANYNRSNCRC